MLGKNPADAFFVFFIEPVATRYGFGELLLKASPLMLCALGLAVGYRANVWNIGAEGQLTDRRDMRRRPGAVAAAVERRALAAADDRRGRRRRHDLGRDPGMAAHALQRQ